MKITPNYALHRSNPLSTSQGSNAELNSYRKSRSGRVSKSLLLITALVGSMSVLGLQKLNQYNTAVDAAVESVENPQTPAKAGEHDLLFSVYPKSAWFDDSVNSVIGSTVSFWDPRQPDPIDRGDLEKAFLKKNYYNAKPAFSDPDSLILAEKIGEAAAFAKKVQNFESADLSSNERAEYLKKVAAQDFKRATPTLDDDSNTVVVPMYISTGSGGRGFSSRGGGGFRGR